MIFTEKIRDRLKKLTRRRWAYKVVRVRYGERVSHQWGTLPSAWTVEYSTKRWAIAPDHSLLMVFSSQIQAQKFRNTCGGIGEVWRVDAKGLRILPKVCKEFEWSKALTSFWDKPNSREWTRQAPNGTLGATKVKLVRKVS